MQSDLHKIIVSPQPLSSDHVKVFLYQILRGNFSSFKFNENYVAVLFFFLFLDVPPRDVLTLNKFPLETCSFCFVPCTNSKRQCPWFCERRLLPPAGVALSTARPAPGGGGSSRALEPRRNGRRAGPARQVGVTGPAARILEHRASVS